MITTSRINSESPELSDYLERPNPTALLLYYSPLSTFVASSTGEHRQPHHGSSYDDVSSMLQLLPTLSLATVMCLELDGYRRREMPSRRRVTARGSIMWMDALTQHVVFTNLIAISCYVARACSILSNVSRVDDPVSQR